jgi:AraC family transcriptional regulator of adaptative response/methylated-DNA-[protein]-cysteine methyltransferase
MERASTGRDASYDGVFYLAVRTTGVFCRPSCPARKPLAENVDYFASVEDAIFAGYRPCKRCRPMDVAGAPPEWIAPLFARVEADPGTRLRDADLRALGMEPARVRRFFLSRHGMTFHAYCRGRRMAGALASIRRGAEIDDVVFDQGYESHSGFRDTFARTFGSPPGRARGRDCMVANLVETPLGPMIAAATSRALCLLEFASRRMLPAQVETVKRRFGVPMVPGTNSILDDLGAQLPEYFAGTRRRFEVPLDAPGTPFQTRVWDALREIPYGETRSYEAIARVVGAVGAVRAVGTANGMNRIAILIPCHRVVRKSGETGGYGGGKWRKVALLQLEGGVAIGNTLA